MPATFLCAPPAPASIPHPRHLRHHRQNKFSSPGGATARASAKQRISEARARFRPQSGALLVVLLDVGFLVPSFQAVVFLLGALQAASRAAGLQPTLEKPGDNEGGYCGVARPSRTTVPPKHCYVAGGAVVEDAGVAVGEGVRGGRGRSYTLSAEGQTASA